MREFTLVSVEGEESAALVPQQRYQVRKLIPSLCSSSTRVEIYICHNAAENQTTSRTQLNCKIHIYKVINLEKDHNHSVLLK